MRHRRQQRILLGVLLLATVAIGWAVFQRTRFALPPTSSSSPLATPEAPITGWLAAREQRIAEIVWAKEMLAQECGRTFESLWEAVIAATNKLRVVAEFDPSEVVLGQWTFEEERPHTSGVRSGHEPGGESRTYPAGTLARPAEVGLGEGLLAGTPQQGIRVCRSSGPGEVLKAGAWRTWMDKAVAAGWKLAQIEFRHNRFETDEAGRPRQSVFYAAAHLSQPSRAVRVIIEGDLVVDWKPGLSRGQVAAVGRVDASRLAIRTRKGEPPFECFLNERVTPPRERFSIDPLILYDLDGDGLSEILLPSVNAVYRRDARDGYCRETLCRFPPGVIFTAILADFDGDGVSDLLCARAEGVVLYQRRAGSLSFEEPERLAWLAAKPLRNPMVLTCGDVDGDGDLDVFLGQYRVPTMGQVLKPWYYDANDGFPAFLLLNDGRGRFMDGTVDAGLVAKRGRRTYTASLTDLDADGRLDLAVVSDFAGLDLYRNDGQGHFTDVTDAWVLDPKAFGMAHALADFNADGRLDLLMIGMNSPTVDRLEHLGLRRPGSEEDFSMRPRMAFGNRLFLARGRGGFEQTALNDAIARSGWSWGCTAADFDNDGFPDVYIANGLQSQASVRDFEPEFWLHDIYVDDSVDDQEATRYFTDKFARTRGRGWSYGGHERNRLYFNRGGETFVEAAFLMGVGLPEDSRNVVSDDLDGDGRMDLLVTTFEVWPKVQQTLRVYLNRLAGQGRWIGFRFPEVPGGRSPIGTAVTVSAGGRSAVRQLITGDSHRSQHAAAMHFGLGAAAQIDTVEIRWPDGTRTLLQRPELNRWHIVRSGQP